MNLAEQIAALGDSLPGLQATLGAAALAALTDPSRQPDADQALAALREATDRLAQLQAALPLAVAAEQEAIAAQEQAERQKTKDRLISKRERLLDLALAEHEKYLAAEAKLPEAQAELDDLARQWRNAKVKVDVLTEQSDNADQHTMEMMEQVEALDLEIGAFPVTAAEVAAIAEVDAEIELAELVAASTAELLVAATERDRLHGEEMIEVDAPYEVEDKYPDTTWKRAAAGNTVRVKRSAAAEHRLAQGRAKQWFERNKAPFELVETGRTQVYSEPDAPGMGPTFRHYPDGYNLVPRRQLDAWLADQDRLSALYNRKLELT